MVKHYRINRRLARNVRGAIYFWEIRLDPENRYPEPLNRERERYRKDARLPISASRFEDLTFQVSVRQLISSTRRLKRLAAGI